MPKKDKQIAAEYALNYLEEGQIIGVGTGSTVDYFIQGLADHKYRLEGVVASSQRTAEQLRALGFPLMDANSVSRLDLYIDGADEATKHHQLIKGGGAALTGEKILAAMSERFVCIIDSTKLVDRLGQFPLPVEVIPLARSFVARELVQLGGEPSYRPGIVTDYGNVILDVFNFALRDPIQVEEQLNQIPGVVTNGLFARRKADELVIARQGQVEVMSG